MGNITEFFRYAFSTAAPKAQGVGTNIANVEGIKEASVYVVSKEGPFDEAKENTPKSLVTDFWKDQTIVLHLLRRFG